MMERQIGVGFLSLIADCNHTCSTCIHFLSALGAIYVKLAKSRGVMRGTTTIVVNAASKSKEKISV